ncbi:amyloid-beta precursor-like protein isoform X1 [Biomphalaria glabrata]|uniref:Amyloid-beta precursor-like protein isoform X1 n=1 Tax=Biomphalaria glabrata TaxID=6526 RepID=A0A9W2YXT9_BIOGL|nr:amyloid-beta precursor-like protein isoform X1 [Biomphalaria glabrata]
MKRLSFICASFSLLQVLLAASLEDKYEPMVAFICERPAMHRGVNGWIPDKSTDCLDRMEDILTYCKSMYPDHNITNVVEASYLVTISDWPMGKSDRQHSHRVRPFRCLVGGFQSDALLVPQHCEFDHRHDQSQCEGFSHWNSVADEACAKKGMHLESFGMLLNCQLGKFSGVEYVCCPVKTETKYQEPQNDDKPDNWINTHEELDKDDDDDDDDNSTKASSSSESTSASAGSSEEQEGNTVDLYEAYLRGQEFPAKYNNEHKKFLAARDQMKKNQQHKITKLLQEWQAARDHVNEVRKTDPKTAETMAKEITGRFQNLYTSYEQENDAEKEQLISLHQQHVQAALNERKREAMDKYMKSLESGDVDRIIRYLRGYIKAEEKDRMHTVNHFEHVKYSSPREAARIKPLIVTHLRLSEQRIDQALEMLTRYPDIEVKVKPEIDEFLKRFDSIANSIKDVVLPEIKVDEEENDSDEDDEDVTEAPKAPAAESNTNTEDINIDEDEKGADLSDTEEVSDGDMVEDNFAGNNAFVAHHQSDNHLVRQGLTESAVTSSQVGSTIGIALGSVSVFVIIVVAIIMLRRKKTGPSVTHGYVEVDPSASPEDRHLANMQMNGYENPTYKYFEVQNNPKA